MTQLPPDPHSPRGYAAPAETSGKAIGALICGILGITGTCGLLGIVAIVLGNGAMQEIQYSNGRITGDGMAKAGIIMGWISVGLMVLGLLLACVFFGFMCLGGVLSA